MENKRPQKEGTQRQPNKRETENSPWTRPSEPSGGLLAETDRSRCWPSAELVEPPSRLRNSGNRLPDVGRSVSKRDGGCTTRNANDYCNFINSSQTLGTAASPDCPRTGHRAQVARSTEVIHSVLGAGSPRSRGVRGCAPPRGSEGFCRALPLSSGVFAPVFGVLGVWKHHPDLHLHLHVASILPGVCLSTNLPF